VVNEPPFIFKIIWQMEIKRFLFVPLVVVSISSFSQKSYEDSINAFLKNYVAAHEVVRGEDKKRMHFYPPDKTFRVPARFAKAADSKWISFPTSGRISKTFKVYGTLNFELNGKPLRLHVYQSQDLMMSEEYRNYLFLPFTDSTTGAETYEGGRYIDLSTKDIKNGNVLLDFNKAYNPYCAYVSGQYNCPLPPKENALSVAIRAGEKAYGKTR
jgi:uncharacterized protein